MIQAPAQGQRDTEGETRHTYVQTLLTLLVLQLRRQLVAVVPHARQLGVELGHGLALPLLVLYLLFEGINTGRIK